VSPQRIQRKRQRGWRMPEGAIYVGRPSRWGNPFSVGDNMMYPHPGTLGGTRPRVELIYAPGEYSWFDVRPIADAAEAVAHFAEWVRYESLGTEFACRTWLSDLRGRDLACWCPLDRACHADELLRLANPTE
jgi:hypothetical protein